MRMGKEQLRCALGKVQFLNRVRDEVTGEVMVYMYTSFKLDSNVQRIMNRAARDTEGVIGVIRVDNTPGVTAGLMLDTMVANDQITAIKRMFYRQFKHHHEEYLAAVPQGYSASMAVHSLTRGRAQD